MKQHMSCPQCGHKGILIIFGASGLSYCCKKCEHSWKPYYVRVEFPDDSSYFEENDIGYPCFNSDDNGAWYVAECYYVQRFGKAPVPERLFRPVSWPESQLYLHHSDSRCEVVMANGKALNDFGDSSVWVPVDLLNK